MIFHSSVNVYQRLSLSNKHRSSVRKVEGRGLQRHQGGHQLRLQRSHTAHEGELQHVADEEEEIVEFEGHLG